MTPLNFFGLFAVAAMVFCYELESRCHKYILGFAFACLLGSSYGFLQGAWPFGIAEMIWAGFAIKRWVELRRSSQAPAESSSLVSIPQMHSACNCGCHKASRQQVFRLNDR